MPPPALDQMSDVSSQQQDVNPEHSRVCVSTLDDLRTELENVTVLAAGLLWVYGNITLCGDAPTAPDLKHQAQAPDLQMSP